MTFVRAFLVAAIGAVGLSLGGSVAVAGPAEDGTVADGELVEAYAPLEVIAIMPEPGQTLLWNETEKKYELGKVGDSVAGWKVVAIEATRVIVTNGSERDELQLVLPPADVRPALKTKARKLPTTVITLGDDTPADKPAVEKPAVEKPIVADKPAVEKPVVAEKPTAEIAEEKHTITRAELNRELGDFDRLLAAVDVTSLEGGGFTLTRVEKTSWPAKMGLRAGDIVRAVANETVTTVEDAARVYARLRTLPAFTIEVDRDGHRLSLQYEVAKAKRP